MASKNRTLVQFELSQAQVDLLFPALKTAEGVYTTTGAFDAADKVGKMHSALKKQLFDFEEVFNLEEEIASLKRDTDWRV